MFDEETGLCYLKSRYYNPTLIRFLNADLLSFELIRRKDRNLYCYCLCAPIKHVDTEGDWTDALGIFASGALGFSVSGCQQFVIDDNGNVGLVGCTSVGGGTPSLALGSALTITNADTIFDLTGIGTSGGGSVSFIGGNLVSGSARDGTPVTGVQISLAPLSLPIPAEGHGTIGYTGVTSLNWIPNWMKKLIASMINSQMQNLSTEVKEEINEKLTKK